MSEYPIFISPYCISKSSPGILCLKALNCQLSSLGAFSRSLVTIGKTSLTPSAETVNSLIPFSCIGLNSNTNSGCIFVKFVEKA